MSITSSSPTHPTEFEFQNNENFKAKLPTTSPADDLFCNGKLLPLHLLPPPLQPSPKLHDYYTTTTPKSILFDSFHLPPAADPFESRNISTSTSCYTSQELHIEVKSWSKKLKLLKTSTAYLKSLFAMSTCSNGSFVVPKAKDSFGQRKVTRKNTFGLMRSFRGDKIGEAFEQRASFSDTVSKFYSSSSSSSTTSSSSCSSVKPIGVNKFVNNSEVENLIQGAIAYCKKSHQSVCGKTSVGDNCEKKGEIINLQSVEAELLEDNNGSI